MIVSIMVAGDTERRQGRPQQGVDGLGVTTEQGNGSAERNPKEMLGSLEMTQTGRYRLCKHEDPSLSIYNPGAEEAETGVSLELTAQPATRGPLSEIR